MKTTQQKQEYEQYLKDSRIINHAYNEALTFVTKASKKSSSSQIKIKTTKRCIECKV